MKTVLVKIALVDIDNILWDFDAPFVSKLEKICTVPPIETWKWNTLSDLVGRKEFMRLVKEVHMHQDLYPAYPDASSFLLELKKLGYYIILASHRCKESKEATKRFLKKNNLVYDRLHISWDKTKLFPLVDLVIDDNPHTLSKADKEGILFASLEYPWNKTDFSKNLFQSLNEIIDFIREKDEEYESDSLCCM